MQWNSNGKRQFTVNIELPILIIMQVKKRIKQNILNRPIFWNKRSFALQFSLLMTPDVFVTDISVVDFRQTESVSNFAMTPVISK